MVSKLLRIAWKDLRAALTDRTLLLIMFAAPLAIATIISVTFGSLAAGGPPIDSIPVGVVNGDEGSPNGDFGEMLLSLAEAREPPTAADGTVTCPEPEEDDGTGTDPIVAYRFPSEEAARRCLSDGALSAFLSLPPAFSDSLLPALPGANASGGSSSVTVALYSRADRPIAGDIARSFFSEIISQFRNAGLSVLTAVSVSSELENLAPESIFQRQDFARLLESLGAQPGEGDAEQSATEPAETVSLRVESETGEEAGFNPLVIFGATQAIFFALFTANGNANSIMEEKRLGTLRRLLAAPNPKILFLLSKLVSTMVVVLVQLLLLFVAFTLVGSLQAGELVFIWGRRVGLILLVLFATSISTAGIGSLIAAFAKTPEQSSVFGTVVALFMAVTGGAFGFTLDIFLRYFSVVYWGAAAFESLAGGELDVGLNLAVMFGFGALAFLLSLFLFKKRYAAAV